MSRRALQLMGPASGCSLQLRPRLREAERIAEHIPRVEARWFACAADAEAAIIAYEGWG